MITDKDRIEWLAKRVAYIEHADKDGTQCAKVPKGCYWPQEVEHETADHDMVGLGLIEYIDAMITAEGKNEH